VGTLPVGLSLNAATGEISGTPTAAGTSNFTVRATDANGAAATKALSIIIYGGLSVTTSSLLDGTVNLTYTQSVSAAGGKTPYLWSVQTGTLPAGLTLNNASGAISGTPTASGTSNFTVRVTDGNGATVDQSLAITVYPALTITTTALSDGTVSLLYNQFVVANGGKVPLTWALTAGVLPAGLSLNTSTGEISGTPTTAGTSNITAQVTDANGAVSTKSLSITIFSGLSVITSSLADGTVNWAYSQNLTAGGGKIPFTWSLVSGTLPSGLSIAASTGIISGIPTAAGTGNFTVQVTDDNGATATRSLSITIYSALSLTTATLSDGTVSAAYNQTLSATGGKTPFVWSISAGSLPTGLAINTSTGVISGTPTSVGTYNFTARVQDANGAPDAKPLTIVVYQALTVSTATLVDGTVNLGYNQTLAVSGGKSPFTWSLIVGSLPAGLSLDTGTGVISGTPTASGTSNFTLQVADGNMAVASKSLSINVYSSLSVTTSSLPAGTRTAPYSQTAASSGGKPPLVWSITAGALPAGLTLNSTTAVISGTPAAVGLANFTLQVQDSNGAAAAKALGIQVNEIPVITTASLSGGTAGATYNQAISFTGAALPVVWSVISGTLPAGLILNSSSGVISGTPTIRGTSNFTVQIADANNITDSKAFSITVTAAAPSRANIVASKTAIISNGTDSATLTVTVYDSYDNLVEDGTTVNVTSTNGTVVGSTTTVNGVVSRTITSTTSGAATLGVQSPAGTTLTNLTGNTSLSFMSGVPSQASIAASKTSIIVDGVDQTVLTITVRDAQGNLITDGTTVKLTTSLGTVTGSGNSVSGVVTRYLSGLIAGTAVLGVESPSGTTLATVTGD
ncbi:MAG: putative Ig domain-containing protein, partial [Gemmatimonadaceae bacterium]|nr:putative Ig domain-containing protein [Gemmatimonadaceae bacterium]